MRNSEAGMTLVETVAALSILVVMVSVLLPIYQVVSLEKQAMIEERKALYYLEQQSLSVSQSVGRDQIVRRNEGIYRITSKEKDRGIETCIQWRGGNKRDYEKCLFAFPNF